MANPPPMSRSAIVVLVPEAEPMVRALRERFDPSAKVGVSAHVDNGNNGARVPYRNASLMVRRFWKRHSNPVTDVGSR